MAARSLVGGPADLVPGLQLLWMKAPVLLQEAAESGLLEAAIKFSGAGGQPLRAHMGVEAATHYV